MPFGNASFIGWWFIAWRLEIYASLSNVTSEKQGADVKYPWIAIPSAIFRRRCRQTIAIVIVHIPDHSGSKLAEIVSTGSDFARLFGLQQHRSDHSGKNGYDRYDHQQLD
jgi:hypothetical protein